MKIQAVVLSILIAFAFAGPIPEGEPTKESSVTTELPASESETGTTLANENAELRSAVDETEQLATEIPNIKGETIEEKKSEEVKKETQNPSEEVPVETTPLDTEKTKALLEKDNTIEEKKVDELSLAPGSPEDHNSTSIKEKRSDLPAEPEMEPTVTPSDVETEKSTIAASTPKADDSSESKESESAESSEKDDKKE